MRVLLKSLRLLVAAALAASLGQTLLAQKSEPRGVPSSIVAAQAFLASAYPDLDLNSTAVTFRLDGTRVLVAISPRSAGPTKKPVEVVPLVVAAVEFDEGGRLQNFSADGVYLEQARNKAFSDALRAHPDWTDGDAEVWLQQNAARQVVGRTFAPPVNFSSTELQTVLGGVGNADKAQFHWRSPGKNGQAAKFAGKPGWILQVVVPGNKGPALHYELEFEPIGERLVRVTRR